MIKLLKNSYETYSINWKNRNRAHGHLYSNGFRRSKDFPTCERYTYHVLGSNVVALPYTEATTKVAFNEIEFDLSDLDQMKELASAARFYRV